MSKEGEERVDVEELATSWMEKLSLDGKKTKKGPILAKDELTLKGVAEAMKDGRIKRVVVMTGAGISVAAGIPDFRTPGTGLYSQLAKYKLTDPTEIFTLR
jgi:NAD+-dependent protein deacetylase sirtuin 2